MSDLRQPFALVAAIRRGLDAIQFHRDHNLPAQPELEELVALMAGELAEVLDALRGERAQEPGAVRPG